jgi:serine/threonine-protein kinase
MIGDVDQIGPATDVWAIGIVAFKLLTGRDFWGAKSSAQLCAMILSDPIVPPSTLEPWLGPAFDAWFLRCVARETQSRFQSAGEAVAHLADALGVRLEPHHASSASFVAASELGPAAVTQSAPPVGPRPASLPPLPLEPPQAKARGMGMFFAIGAAVLVGAGVLVYALAFRTKPADAHVGLVSSATSQVAPSLVASEAASETTPAATVAPVEPVRTATARTADPVAAKPKETATPAKAGAPLTRDQRKRLDSLQRLCDQGTFTPAECQAKRSSITNGP